MKLKTKAIILCAVSSISITSAVGGLLYASLWRDRLASTEKSIAKQLKDMSFSLRVFIEGMESDLETMAANESVRTRDDSAFTSFLNADEKSFSYHYSAAEKRIIEVFNGYRLTHKYVSSVYMGRENGSFVRSHEREAPTQYDPRTRPWYVLAKKNPGAVVETDAYPSLTTNDVNIGFEKALIGGDGVFYGVVGIDATLVNLTDYLVNFGTDPHGEMILLDGGGTVLASQNKEMRAADIETFAPGLSAFGNAAEGSIRTVYNGAPCIAFYSAPTPQGWRLAALIPSRNIQALVRAPVLLTVAALAAGFLILAAAILIGFNLIVIRPVGRLTEDTRRIARTSDLGHRIGIRGGDEIGQLAARFNEMLGALQGSNAALLRKESDLREYRNRLEELVEQRTRSLQKTNEELKREIAERVALERMLVERESQYRDLVETANTMILRWLPNGSVVYINGYAQSFFGYTAAEILGKSIIGSIVAASTDARALVSAIVGQPETHVRSVNENTCRDGRRVWVAWANKAVPADEGGIKEILSIGIDITQLIQAERGLRRALSDLAAAKEKAESADRLKSLFLATMSHELRTPLNSIIGFTGIILQGMVGPLNAEQEKQLSMVRTSAQHLLMLINDVLDISKIEAGQMTVGIGPMDLRASVEKVTRIVREMAEKKNLGLDVDVSLEAGIIPSDARRVEQVLLNLVSNAVKFTEKGRVSVRCAVDGGNAVFTVTDTGIGIRAEDMDKIFKPFQQLDTGLSRAYEGTGLGLSISKKLVELLGGRIWAESEPGRGSTFGFSLPREKGAA